MDKLRNFKHRLSLSVDKLSSTRRSKSPQLQRKSMPLGSPLSEGDIPASVESSSALAGGHGNNVSAVEVGVKVKSRPSSLVETKITNVTLDSVKSADEQTINYENSTTIEKRTSPITINSSSHNLSSEQLSPADSSPIGLQSTPRNTSTDGTDSLMIEVLKEVSKIADLPPDFKTLDKDTKYNVVKEKKQSDQSQSRENINTVNNNVNTLFSSSDKISSISDKEYDDTDISSSKAVDSLNSLISKRLSKIYEKESESSACTTLSTISTINAESITSGYFTDTASDVTLSESKESFSSIEKKEGPHFTPLDFSASKISMEDTRIVTSSPPPSGDLEKPAKKESIYSRLKRTTKRGLSPSTNSAKEPIYAKIKPKLKMDTSFKPIEPSSKQTGSPSAVVKPEPIYSKVKSKGSVPTSPISPGFPDTESPFIPSSPTSPESPSSSFKKTHKIYPYDPLITTEFAVFPDNRNKKETKPKTSNEPIYSKVKKRLSSTFETKTPIYSQPLPAVPAPESGFNVLSRHEADYSTTSSSDYGKVTVRAREISPTSPSKPSVITISNPGYSGSSKPSGITSPSGTILNPSSFHPRGLTPSPTFIDDTKSPSPSDAGRDRLSVLTPSSIDPGSMDNIASQLSIVQSHDSDTESTSGKGRLSKLVEELAQELETVTQNLGSSVSTDENSKKEVLYRLLSTYDVPKNLKRVEEADYAEIKRSEKTLITSLSQDELRFMDESDDKFETVYSDVPDYSQDEFVIALDDENDPKYASLTRCLMEANRSTDSPGRVSRKSAQVYVNVINVISALKVLVNSNSSRAQTVISKMGTIARPYANKVSNSITDTSWIQRKIYHKSVRFLS